MDSKINACLDQSYRRQSVKFQLKSSIPKPVPYIRLSREARSKSCSSSYFCRTRPSSCIKESAFGYNKRSVSQTCPATFCTDALQESRSKQTQESAATVSYRSHSTKTTKSSKNQYSYVKSRIDNKMPVSLLLKNLGAQSNDHWKQPGEAVNMSSEVSSPVEAPPGDQISERKIPCDEDLVEKKNQFITHYNGQNNLQPPENWQPVEDEISFTEENEILFHMEGSLNSYLKECAPEFLSSFEKKMGEISEFWLQLICELIITKMTIGKSALSELSLHKPTLGLRNEISKFFKNLPTQGELLYKKLHKIEEDQERVLTVLVRNVVALAKEHEDLKNKYSRLEKTQDQRKSQLEEELAILGNENKELDRNLMLVTEKYNLEKLNTEEQQKNQIEMFKNILDLKKAIKHVHGKCNQLETRGQQMENSRTNLEHSLRNLEDIQEKEKKKYEDLFKIYNKSENTIKELKSELEEARCSRSSLEGNIKELQTEITNLNTTLNEYKQKRNEMVEEVSNKTKKLNELETELNSLKNKRTENNQTQTPQQNVTTDKDNPEELNKDLVSDVERRDLQILDLKKKINHLEHMLREKSNQEDKLTTRLLKLNKKSKNNTMFLNSQINELQNTVKDLQSEVSELKKVLGQKTLDLDKRDKLIREYTERLQLDDEFKLRQNRKFDDKKCTEKPITVEVEPYTTENQVDKELSFRQEKMIEMFSLLERKQMEIMKMERRILGIQKFRDEEERAGKKYSLLKPIDGTKWEKLSEAGS